MGEPLRGSGCRHPAALVSGLRFLTIQTTRRHSRTVHFDFAMPVFTPPDVEFQILAQPLIGLNVSLPWKGYGTAIFLELGALAPEKSRGHCYNKGEACIGVEWDWRVEAAGKVLYGSSNSRPKMMAGIKGQQGSTIQSLAVGGEVPELVIQFSNGHYLRSMVMAAGNPEWTIRLADGRWVYAMNGRIVNDHGEADPSEADDPVFDAAKLAAS